MLEQLKDPTKRRWPRLRLRTLVFATLFFVAALPGVAAMFLRVYENTLVRQTESELVAQGAAIAAVTAMLWPDAPPPMLPATTDLRPEPPRIDLSTTPILPARPTAWPSRGPPDPAAMATSQQLAPLFAQTRRTTLASIILLDHTGTIVSGTDAGGSLSALPEVRTALAGGPDTVLRRAGDYRPIYTFEWISRAAAIRVHHARPVVVGDRVVGVLLLSRSARALFRGIYEDRGKIAFGIVAILAALVVLSSLLSRGVTRPIERLGQATRAVAAGRGSVPEIPATAAIEIQGLYADFRTMAAAIERRSRYLRDVAYAVSHEFKTPLAAIRGAVELLEDHPDMPAADRCRFLGNVHADADRLAQLVTRLLDLARADMSDAAPGVCTALAPVIAQVADANAITIVADLSADVPAVATPAASLETVLAILVDNSRQAGAKRVMISGERWEGSVRLRVADDGPGVAPADAGRLFEPFFTTRRVEGGTGLGLTIARSLLDAVGAEVDVVSGDSGTTFELRLPIAPG